MNNQNQVIFFGGGNMAQAIIAGLLKCNIDKNKLIVIDPDKNKRQEIEKKFTVLAQEEIKNHEDNATFILATKPDQIPLVCEGIKGRINNQLIISIAAGVKISFIQGRLNNYDQIVRTMPNLVAQIQKSVTAAYAHPNLKKTNKALANFVLESFGDCIWVNDEKKLNAATAISGSGPAYVFLFLQAIISAGENIGLTLEESQALALKMLQGSAMFAENNISKLETLIKNVTSKGGTTDQALKHFKEKNFQKIVGNAINAAYKRAEEIGDN